MASTVEKGEQHQFEDTSMKQDIDTSTQESAAVHSKAVLRIATLKVDIGITASCAILYLLAFIDKSNLGNARVAGLGADLKLTSHQYSIAATILFIPYILTELPANLLLKKIGAHILLPIVTVSFGLVCTLQGLVTSYPGLVVARVFLGATEGGLIPALVLLLSTYFRRDQFQVRVGFLFGFSALSGAFSGFLAAAILKLDGAMGRPGWQWIFIIEGAVTIGVGIAMFFILSPDIESAWWLKPEEKVALRAHFNEGGRGAEAAGEFSWAEVKSALTSPFILMMLPAWTANGLISFGLSYFQPTLVATLGYGRVQTQVYSAFPYLTVFLATLPGSYLADKWGRRAPYISFFGLLSAIGYIINLTTDPTPRYKHARYGALFLSTFGGFGNSPALSAWTVDNTAPHYKRGTAIAMSFICVQFGGIISTWIYPTTEAPRYRTGAIVSLTAAVVLIVSPIGASIWVSRENARKAELLKTMTFNEEEVKPLNDRDPRYTYSQ